MLLRSITYELSDAFSSFVKWYNMHDISLLATTWSDDSKDFNLSLVVFRVSSKISIRIFMLVKLDVKACKVEARFSQVISPSNAELMQF